MKLDPVGRDSRLAVQEVEERDAGDACASAHARDTPGIPHLLASVGGCASRAERRRSLGDHGLPTHPEDVVVVEISLGAVESDGSSDREDLSFERHPRKRERCRPGQTHKVSHCRCLSAQQLRAILQGLYRPALDATCQCS